MKNKQGKLCAVDGGLNELVDSKDIKEKCKKYTEKLLNVENKSSQICIRLTNQVFRNVQCNNISDISYICYE